MLLDGVNTVANTDSLFANSLIKLKVLLLDGVDTIKYSTLNTDAFRVTKVYNPQNAFKLSFNKPRDITVHLSSTRSWYIMKLLHVKKTLK